MSQELINLCLTATTDPPKEDFVHTERCIIRTLKQLLKEQPSFLEVLRSKFSDPDLQSVSNLTLF